MALGTSDPAAAQRWTRIAKDYDTLAEAVAEQDAKEAASKILHVPMQQNAQPVQQQQSKVKPDDK